MRGYYDASGRLIACEKVVYGEIEMEHRYEYHPNDTVSCAEIALPDEDVTVIRFDEQGARLPAELR